MVAEVTHAERIFAIDPGPEQSGWMLLVGGFPEEFGTHENGTVQEMVRDVEGALVIEAIESFGMSVGRDVFMTAYWVGRFDPHSEAALIGRREVKLHLCNSARAKDSNIRQALIDRFGPGKEKAIGLKVNPGPLHGIAGHMWSALALAVTYYDRSAVGL